MRLLSPPPRPPAGKNCASEKGVTYFFFPNDMPVLVSESRVPWTKEALECLQTTFSREIRDCVFPGYGRIRALSSNHSSTPKGGTEAQITARLQNMTKKRSSSYVDSEPQLHLVCRCGALSEATDSYSPPVTVEPIVGIDRMLSDAAATHVVFNKSHLRPRTR